MNQVYAFHETVRGHLHILSEMPCEDSSISFSAEDGRYNIAIVADGHGSKSCYRSDVGSKTAADVALGCLKELAEAALESKAAEDRFYNDMFSSPRYRKMMIRQLTDTIIARWYNCVVEHFKSNPPSLEEISGSTENDKNIVHIYGTTLIAALKLPKCLILIQQGDGRCDVFYEDGFVDQPIPWDARCQDTTTTSLCDEDAADSFRSYVIDLTDKPVMACYLGTDGIEDAYRDTYEGLGGSHSLMGGVHTFYKDLTCQLAVMGQVKFENYLKTMLPEFSADGKFSRSGSGDDISVAGIVDVDIIQKFVERFQYDVKQYDLEEALYWKEDELRSKTRKHGILQKRVEEIQSALKEEQIKQQSLEKELQQLREKRQKFFEKVGHKRAELKACNQESLLVKERLDYDFRHIIMPIRHFFQEISVLQSSKEKAYDKMCKDLSIADEQIKIREEKQNLGVQKIREFEKKLAEAQADFQEYDTKYQAIEAERIRIQNEIDLLHKRNQVTYDMQLVSDRNTYKIGGKSWRLL